MGQANVKRKKIDAVLTAACLIFDKNTSIEQQAAYLQELKKAVEDYNSLPAAPAPDAPPVDLNAFHCPHCEAERPPYGWHFNIGDTGPFALQWITCFCGECKTIIAVSVVQFMPKQELVDQLKRQFGTKVHIA